MSIDAALREEVEQHIRDHVVGERARVERVSRIREVVLGAQDGLLVPPGVVTGMAANPNVFLQTKVEKELGLSPDAGGAALGDRIVVGLSYLLAAIVPLWPNVAFGRVTALVVSVMCKLIALFALGVFKGRVGRQPQGLAGVQVLAIGGISAAVGFAIGHLVTQIV